MDAGAWETLGTAAVGVLTLVGTLVTLYASRRSEKANAQNVIASSALTQIQAKGAEFELAQDVLTYMARENRRYLDLQAEDARKGRMIAALVESIQEHEAWDKEILRTIRMVSRKMEEAGMGKIPMPRDPPPLSRHFREAEATVHDDQG